MDKLCTDGVKCPEIANLEKNNARTGGGICAVRCADAPQPTPILRNPETGCVGSIQADGSGIG